MFKDLMNKNYFKKIIITIILKHIINKVGHFNFNDGKIFSMNSFYISSLFFFSLWVFQL